MRVHLKSLVPLLLVALVGLTEVLAGKKLKRLQTDAFAKTRCDLMCPGSGREQKTLRCRSQCRIKQVKLGTCPASDTTSGWDAACVKACEKDAQCEGTQRCCKIGKDDCGTSCFEPVDLHTLPGLPPVPKVAEPKEKCKAVIVKWSSGVGDTARAVLGKVLYLLQEQHHYGPNFNEAKFGPWNLITRTNKTKVTLRNVVLPGHWYRFRVAAVSVEGTRGYSNPSPVITSRKGPRPPLPPKKLRVNLLSAANGNITVRLNWKEPRSDLPIVRYKVFWSRRVKGLKSDLDSVLVSHQIVPKEKKNFVDIKDLLPNSMYFFQVQTVSQYGQGKLRSEKASIFYNTTNADGNFFYPPSTETHRKKEVTGLKLLTYLWSNSNIAGRIVWDAVREGSHKEKYHINWKTMKCVNDEIPKIDLSAMTQKTFFDIYEIEFDCIYSVLVNNSELVVNVPSCSYMEEKLLNKKGLLGCETYS